MPEETMIEKIKGLLDEGKDEDVTKLLTDMAALKKDAVKKYLEDTDEGKGLAQSLSDSASSRWEKHFRENKLPGILKDELDRLEKVKNPPADPEKQKLIDRLNELEKNESTRSRTERILRNKDAFAKACLEKNLPAREAASILECLDLDMDAERAAERAPALAEALDKLILTGVEAKIKGNAHAPLGSDPVSSDSDDIDDEAYLAKLRKDRIKK